LIQVGEKDGEPVAIRLTGWHGLALLGEGVEDVARAWLAALLSRAGVYGVEILAPALLLDRVLPDVSPMPAIRRLADREAVVHEAELLVVGRTRKLEDAGAPDADSYQQSNPEDPLPVVILLADGIEPSSRRRWNAVLEQGAKLGIDALLVGMPDEEAENIATAAVRVDSDYAVASARPDALNLAVCGMRPYLLRPADATALLRPLASMALPVEDEPYPAVNPADVATRNAEDVSRNGRDEQRRDADQCLPSIEVRPPAEPWPDVPVRDSAEALISVELLGPPRICVAGNEVLSGLRSSARELFAWFLLHPEGATAGAAIEALWPDVPPERGPQRFWTALGNLRSRLRDLAGQPVEVVAKSGEHYHPEFGVLDVDVWRFQAALRECANTEPTIAMEALERATDAYRGDLVQGLDYFWIEPVREDLHRRALDAHVRLAELQAEADLLDAAIETLDRAITIDPVAEELYRRSIDLLARGGRHDAIGRTWAKLVTNLADLDLDPDAETVSLMRRVSASREGPQKRRQRLTTATPEVP
jgi:DNA-binding SARP family transcriptional activator